MANDNGLRDTLAAIARAAKAASSINKALVQSGEELARTQRLFAETNRNTGALINSIAVTKPGQSTPPYSQPGGSRVAGEHEVIVSAGNPNVRYAHLVEFGTVKAEAQPFFWPAFRLKKKKLLARIKRATRKVIKEGFTGKQEQSND